MNHDGMRGISVEMVQEGAWDRWVVVIWEELFVGREGIVNVGVRR